MNTLVLVNVSILSTVANVLHLRHGEAIPLVAVGVLLNAYCASPQGTIVSQPAAADAIISIVLTVPISTQIPAVAK
jgi:hypothetical protein